MRPLPSVSEPFHVTSARRSVAIVFPLQSLDAATLPPPVAQLSRVTSAASAQPRAKLPRMPNRLAQETSPYLLQHAENPVDWYPWGEEAFAKARSEDKPILLSIGYSACHWCHVMERESFESAETAKLMNESFVSVKVDREERPDVDSIYMDAVQALTGSGGWPLTVFLSPDGEPFFGGTYFPPEPRPGLRGFRELLETVGKAWREKREDVEKTMNALTDHLRSTALTKAPEQEVVLEQSMLFGAMEVLMSTFDWEWGASGGRRSSRPGRRSSSSCVRVPSTSSRRRSTPSPR